MGCHLCYHNVGSTPLTQLGELENLDMLKHTSMCTILLTAWLQLWSLKLNKIQSTTASFREFFSIVEHIRQQNLWLIFFSSLAHIKEFQKDLGKSRIYYLAYIYSRSFGLKLHYFKLHKGAFCQDILFSGENLETNFIQLIYWQF